MVLIQVRKKDADTVFSILLHNGRFSELSGNRFRIDENETKTLKKIKQKRIHVEKL